ncbi:MAG: hypothetical protein QM758_11860 [Armatimonas sp.]
MYTRKWSSLLLGLIALWGVLSVVAGCAKKEEPQPTGYYSGPREAKGSAPAQGQPNSKMNVQ